jgi:multiple sugar transport system permease protein
VRLSRGGGIKRGRTRDGWLFVSPAVIVLGLFLLLPVLMAAWVSVSDWRGNGSPLSSDVSFVGLDNYKAITTGGTLAERDFGGALRNNLYYVVLVVPIQTALALFLAVMVQDKLLRGRGFFRTAFYFPSVTSAVAITVLWLFLFNPTGAVNQMLGWIGVNGPNWFQEPRGLIHLLLGVFGVDSSPAPLADHGFLGITWWDWVSGPSVAMTALILMAAFTTSGTMMLIFLAALNNISDEVYEAGRVDGAGSWARFRYLTLPLLRPTMFTVLTLGLVGSWQVFDQIYTGTRGGPAKTTVTPAYLSFNTAFNNQQWGQGAAIAFILFAIIVILTLLQRAALRSRT